MRFTPTSCTRRTLIGPIRLALVTVTLLPALAHAQSAQPFVPPATRTPWDVTFMTGFLAGHPEMETTRGYHDDWFHTGQGGISLGRHLTTHLKAEVEFTASGEGRQFVERYITVPGQPYPIPTGSEQYSSLRQVVGAVSWQFFDNEWVHPFLHAGIAVDFDRVRTHTWAQEFFTGDPRLPTSRVVTARESNEGPTTTARARAVLGGGVKMYASPRIFVRTDARFATGGGEHLTFRIGIGVDF